MPLSYLRDDCHKQAVTHIRESQRFKLMYTLQGKTHSVHFLRIVPVWDNISLALKKSKQAPTPRKSLGKQRQTAPVVALGDLIPPPIRQPWSRGERFWPNYYIATSAYWAYITILRSVRSILVHGGQPNGP
jgi:hypothetical protein